MPDRPVAGQLETRAAPDVELDGRRLRGVIPYGVESRDLGGWREVIDRGRAARRRLDDLIVTVEHAGVPLGRYPRTLEVEDRDDGLHWSRRAARVARRRARGGRARRPARRLVADARRARRVARRRPPRRSRSPSCATSPSSPPPPTRPPPSSCAHPPRRTPPCPRRPPRRDAARAALRARGGPLRARGSRTAGRAGDGLQRPRWRPHGPLPRAGFPGETAVLAFEDVFESRALTVTGGPDPVARGRAPPAWRSAPISAGRGPAFPRVAVDAGDTSVDVLRQTARTLADRGEHDPRDRRRDAEAGDRSARSRSSPPR